MKISHRTDPSKMNWTSFKYMVFDTPNSQGDFSERFKLLGKISLFGVWGVGRGIPFLLTLLHFRGKD